MTKNKWKMNESHLQNERFLDNLPNYFTVAVLRILDYTESKNNGQKTFFSARRDYVSKF